MPQRLDYLSESPSQTAGPYVHIGCTPNFAGISVFGSDLGAAMKTGPVLGEEITINCRVFDGMDAPLRDVMVEIWQADAGGLFSGTDDGADPYFTGFGRSPSNLDTGSIHFDTVKPGAVVWPDGRLQAPHISVWIVARGINIGLQTRMYFSDEADANGKDPVLTRIEHQARVATLIAERGADNDYQFDIHLQGPKETVFFDI